MNTGLITSFVISGFLLLAILAMNLNLSHSSTGLTMREIAQQHKQTMGTLLNNDIPKIGYDEFSAISNPISVAKKDDLVFQSNINRNGVKTVKWFFDTSNSTPDGPLLKRIVGGDETAMPARVTDFTFTYLDAQRNALPAPVSDPSKIRYIKVSFTVNSKEKLGRVGSDSSTYISSPWEKTFSPKNL